MSYLPYTDITKATPLCQEVKRPARFRDYEDSFDCSNRHFAGKIMA